MVKASALYMVIIIALVIAIICSSLVATAYFFKAENLKKQRLDRLETNVISGINILLTNHDSTFVRGQTISLFGKDEDSVSLIRFQWGIYDIGVSKAFIQKDTVTKVFSIAYTIDSSKWAALYLMDEQRPFSVSGNTLIKGDAYIPQAGVQAAYINNTAYLGDKRLIIGNKHFSSKVLPALDDSRLNYLQKLMSTDIKANGSVIGSQFDCSFSKPIKVINLSKVTNLLSSISVSGNCIIYSDTTLIIDKTAILNNVLILAKSIIVESGFNGNAQFFAVDSISVGSDCEFKYPSCLGVIRTQAEKVFIQPTISIGKNTTFNGVIFTYDKTQNPVTPLIVIGQSSLIKGQMYSQGQLELNDQSEIDGSVFTSRFLYKSSSTTYENYLVNTTINSTALSSYYLTSNLLPVAKAQNKILQWLEVK